MAQEPARSAGGRPVPIWAPSLSATFSASKSFSTLTPRKLVQRGGEHVSGGLRAADLAADDSDFAGESVLLATDDLPPPSIPAPLSAALSARPPHDGGAAGETDLALDVPVPEERSAAPQDLPFRIHHTRSMILANYVGGVRPEDRRASMIIDPGASRRRIHVGRHHQVASLPAVGDLPTALLPRPSDSASADIAAAILEHRSSRPTQVPLSPVSPAPATSAAPPSGAAARATHDSDASVSAAASAPVDAPSAVACPSPGESASGLPVSLCGSITFSPARISPRNLDHFLQTARSRAWCAFIPTLEPIFAAATAASVAAAAASAAPSAAAASAAAAAASAVAGTAFAAATATATTAAAATTVPAAAAAAAEASSVPLDGASLSLSSAQAPVSACELTNGSDGSDGGGVSVPQRVANGDLQVVFLDAAAGVHAPGRVLRATSPGVLRLVAADGRVVRVKREKVHIPFSDELALSVLHLSGKCRFYLFSSFISCTLSPSVLYFPPPFPFPLCYP